MRWWSNTRARRALAGLGSITLLAAAVRCSSAGSGDPCNPGDADGVIGGDYDVQLTVSDTAFAVGAPDSGSTEPNIAVQNLGRVTLTMTNVGTKPHDFVVRCLPTPNTNGCAMQSCFPPEAGIAPLRPGQSATTTFVTPATEGAYPFVSDQPDDIQTEPDGGIAGLVGEFVLM